jgi:hypothetical protein
MPYILDVRPLRQASSMSCWWTCFRMMREYARLETPPHPSLFHPAFRSEPFRASTSPLPRFSYTYSAPVSAQSMSDGSSAAMLDPSEWYNYGVPTQTRPLTLLQQLTGLRAMEDRPPLRQWTIQHFREKLDQYGPFVFLSNWNSNGQHAVLVTGVMYDSAQGSVVFNDPAPGIERCMSISDFNNLMPQLAMIRDNPLWLAQAAGVNRTRVNSPDSF